VISKRFSNFYFYFELFFFYRQVDYTLRKGTTEVLSTTVKKIEFDIVNEKVKTTTGGHEAMELA
jgi:hypothetical protein